MFRRSSARAAAAAWAVLFFAAPTSAFAYDAIVAWRPVDGAIGYRVYHSPEAGAERATAVNVGVPSPSDDGLIRYVVQDVPLRPTSYFAVAAYDASGRESERSNVLTLTHDTVVSVLGASGDLDHDEITAGGFE